MKFLREGIGEIPGLFGIEHLLFVLIAIILLFLLLFFTLKNNNININKIIKISFWILLILEILKIIWNLTIRVNSDYDDWIPLYFCSIIIYASFLASYTKGKLRNVGLAFLYHGGIIAGAVFIIAPTTCLLVHPFIHILTFHSLLFHVVGIYLGLIVVIKKIYKPDIKSIWGYLIITFSVCLLAFVFNKLLDCNLMMINDDNSTWPLTLVYKTFKSFYPLVVSVLQNFGTFFISLGVYKLIVFLKKRRG